MRELSDSEQEELQRRQANFDSFLSERMPVLKDFFERLEVPNAALVVAEPGSFLPSLDAFMRDQQISGDDRTWILTRLGYYIGEWLVERFGGCWFVNDVPESRSFLRYVVGRFTRLGNSNAMIDPFLIAEEFLQMNAPRSLSQLLTEVAADLDHAEPPRQTT